MKRNVLFFALVFVFAASTTFAIEIMPVSYSFDQDTDGGLYSYTDWGGIQLVDGEYGAAQWSADYGNGPAYEWVGWKNDPVVNIDFDFGVSSMIDIVQLGSLQTRLTDAVFPKIQIYTSADNLAWSFITGLDVPESSANNNSYQTFGFSDLNLDTQFLRISLLHSLDGPWTFTDEVDFFRYDEGTYIVSSLDVRTAVPEPATIFLLGFGLAGLAGVAGMRKRKK